MGRPIALRLTQGQAHDGEAADALLAELGDGQILPADRAYASDRSRERLRERGAGVDVKRSAARIWMRTS